MRYDSCVSLESAVDAQYTQYFLSVGDYVEWSEHKEVSNSKQISVQTQNKSELGLETRVSHSFPSGLSHIDLLHPELCERS